MKITEETIQQFIMDQKAFGIEAAIHNILWMNAAELLKDLGAKSIHTTGTKLDHDDVIGQEVQCPGCGEVEEPEDIKPNGFSNLPPKDWASWRQEIQEMINNSIPNIKEAGTTTPIGGVVE